MKCGWVFPVYGLGFFLNPKSISTGERCGSLTEMLDCCTCRGSALSPRMLLPADAERCMTRVRSTEKRLFAFRMAASVGRNLLPLQEHGLCAHIPAQHGACILIAQLPEPPLNMARYSGRRQAGGSPAAAAAHAR